MSGAITLDELRKLVDGWLAAGKRVAGPVQTAPGLALFTPLQSAAALLLDGWLRPSNSIKEFVFPRHEALYGYRVEKNRIELTDLPVEAAEQIVIGAHPCDAAALPILDKVFNWDFRDEFYNRRRELTTVISIACTSSDEECFCTSVGLGPAAERGSDAMLFDQGDGSYVVRVLTEKGRALFPDAAGAAGLAASDAAAAAAATAPDALATAGSAAAAPIGLAASDAAAAATGTAPDALATGVTVPAGLAGPKVKFAPEQVAAFARDHFESPFWAAHALACVGCGACAYTCPVCHCFDIVDEGRGGEGVRARNWDACQFPMFTLHASGHNPRATQGGRQRQRIYHKFYMYPEKFGDILCTGCGNCARNCPVGLGVLPVVSEISNGEPVQA